MSSHDSDIGPHIRNIIDKMFIYTADQDYLLARVAFWSGVELGFLWNSAQCLEKYFKAILLYNGFSVIEYGHDLEKLFEKIRVINPIFDLDEFPENPQIWKAFNKKDLGFYINTISKIGNPNNRYLTYGHAFHDEYLYALDFIVWYYRRFCRRQFWKFQKGGEYVKIDLYKSIIDGHSSEKLSGFLPIDRLLDKKTPEFLYDLFLNSNFAFCKNLDPSTRTFGSASHESPFREYFNSTNSDKESVERKIFSSEVLIWAKDNIFFQKNDKKEIEAAIKKVLISVASKNST